MIRARGATVALASLFVFGAACGNSSDIPDSVSSSLNGQVDRIEQMASVGDYAGAQQHAGDLRTLVIEQRASGRLDDASAERILGAVSVVESALAASVVDASPPVAPTVALPSTIRSPSSTVSTTVKPPTTTTTKRKPHEKDK